MCLAVPGQILNIQEHDDPLFRMGTVSFNGVTQSVSLAYLPEAKVSDYVIVHVGFALSIISPEAASETLNHTSQ